jgi:membrane protease YdiL (CAAX protease family)
MRTDLLIILTYILLRFVFVNQLESFVANGIYIFEIALVIAGLIRFRKHIKIDFDFSRPMVFQMLITYGLGFGTYKLGQFLGLQAPFNVNTKSAIFMLVLFGPILEELLFRFTLFHHISKVIKSHYVANLLISMLFSFSHFYAYMFISNQSIKQFILFQTAYTFVISFWWTLVYIETKRIYHPIFLHILFNSGFFLAMHK